MNGAPSSEDEAHFVALGAALADAIEAVIIDWIVRSVIERAEAAGVEVSPGLRAAAEQAGHEARGALLPPLRDLLGSDADAQQTNPLSLIRGVVRFPTAVLQAADVPPVRRDEAAEHLFPDDVYDLSPATWSDIDSSVQEPGLAWSAGKAFVVIRRRRAEGR